MSLVSHLKEAEKIELTGGQIHQLTKGICRPLPYHELDNIKDIDELFENHLAVMLLYETDKDFGHWVVLNKFSDHIEFFDPYGIFPDDELKQASYNLRIHDGEVVPHLTHLLENQPLKVIYNKVKLQQVFKDVNTCGRHCALRTVLRDMPLDKYTKLLTTNAYYNPDIWATTLTVLYSI